MISERARAQEVQEIMSMGTCIMGASRHFCSILCIRIPVGSCSLGGSVMP